MKTHKLGFQRGLVKTEKKDQRLDFSVSEFESFGWRHYSKVDFVRGCVGESARDCVQLWVDTTKTSNVSITCQWTLADGEDTSFLAEQENRAHIFQHLKSHCF